MITPSHNLQRVSEEVNDKLIAPHGWFIPEDIVEEKLTSENEADSENLVLKNLPLAARIAEDLVEAIEQRTNIVVPESYLRVETDTKFHIVLLVDASVFHSPEMVIAHILAKDCTQAEDRFDIHFSFSIQTEFIKRRTMYPEDYKLKHEHHFSKVRAGAYPHFIFR